MRRQRIPGSPAVLLVGVAVLATACTLPGRPSPRSAPSATADSALPAPTATWNAGPGSVLAAGSALRVTVHGGLLTGLDVVDGSGRRLPSRTAVGSGSADALPPDVTVTATATMTAPDGTVRRSARSVRTGAPEHALSATITPGDSRTVGVGQPIIVDFDAAVHDHAAAEQALHVATDRPVGEAAWHWFSDTEVQYRSRTFWPSGTRIVVTARLDGVRTGATTWGVKDTTSTFTIGRSQVLRIDAIRHLMTVVRDGRDIRSVPVSLGQDKGTWRTRSGIKTIMTVERTVHMDSRTVGIDGSDAYDEDVPYAMRLTWSGEYVHAAPWSEAAQGKRDVSHGCTNVSMVNGKWLFDNSMVGDPVVTTGTSRPMESGNGWGGGWNLDWRTWTAGSALH